MKMIQVRNVPEEIHRELKVRAARQGVSLSDYVLELARRDVLLPTVEEWMAQVESRPRVKIDVSIADIIREHRGPLPE
ncbi:MAG: FitA-like ribbon-helix-helix domain-containing protein [Gaiellaceae bacterium]